MDFNTKLQKTDLGSGQAKEGDAKKTGLTKAMVTGRATEAPGKVSGADGGISRNRLAAGMALMAGLQLAAHALPLLRPAW